MGQQWDKLPSSVPRVWFPEKSKYTCRLHAPYLQMYSTECYGVLLNVSFAGSPTSGY